MKNKIIILAITGLIMSGCDTKSREPKTEIEKEQYSIGVNIAKNFSESNINIEIDWVIEGLKDAHNKDLKLSPEEVDTHVANYFKKQELERRRKNQKIGLSNQEIGEKFLKANKKREGVTETQTGLQYRIIHKSKNQKRKPKATDTVSVHYRGTLINGQEFDSSYKRNSPASFPLNGVIKGWTEGVQLMNVGDKFEFFIPSKLAYGKRGAGQLIGPNSVLIFEVELLDIQ